MNTRPPVFSETQRWRDQSWVMVFVIGLAAFTWYTFIEQVVRGRPVGNNPGPDWMVSLYAVLFGLGFPLFFLRLRLTVEVYPDHLRIDYGFLTRREILLRDIARVEAVRYNPLMEWGGWGIRGWGNRIAYNVGGNEGVQLWLRDGRLVMVGSQQAADLAAAILDPRL